MERGTFVEIDHTADIGLDLEGPGPESILEAAQRGLTQLLLADASDLVPEAERRVTVEASDYPELLKAWCERLYRLIEEEGFVPLDSSVEAADPADCRAVVRGALPPPERIAEASELKAVTYHQLAFEPRPGGAQGWLARVIFDV
jgi:SHS2 domain-containing protein